jgi:hypothetical protein
MTLARLILALPLLTIRNEPYCLYDNKSELTLKLHLDDFLNAEVITKPDFEIGAMMQARTVIFQH